LALPETLVFRREDSDWRLVHRRADALVHPITMEQLFLLARGSVEPADLALLGTDISSVGR
jgi:hypothetical protein